METTVKERITFYVKSLKISKSEFYRVIGVSETYIGSIRESIQPDKLKRIAVNYPELNIGWLITGEGEMLKGGGVQPILKEKDTNYRLVPLYNIDARGGFNINEVSADEKNFAEELVPSFVGAIDGDIAIRRIE